MDRAKEEVERMVTGDAFLFFFCFKTEPRKYQSKCLTKLYPVQASAIISDPGTGKSKMALDLFCARRMEDKIGSLVIICKYTLRDNWVDQIEQHSALPMDIYLPSTDKKEQFKKWARKKHDFPVVIVGIESFSAGAMASMVRDYVRTAYKPAGLANPLTPRGRSPFLPSPVRRARKQIPSSNENLPTNHFRIRNRWMRHQAGL